MASTVYIQSVAAEEEATRIEVCSRTGAVCTGNSGYVFGANAAHIPGGRFCLPNNRRLWLDGKNGYPACLNEPEDSWERQGRRSARSEEKSA